MNPSAKTAPAEKPASCLTRQPILNKDEKVLASLVRARFCGLIAPKVHHGSGDLFLIGMFSLMDPILEVPMGVVIEGVAFDAETRTELLGMKTGKTTTLSPIYELMDGA